MKKINLLTGLLLLLAILFGNVQAQQADGQETALTLALQIVFQNSTKLDEAYKAMGLAGTGSDIDVDVKLTAGYADKPSLEYPTGIDKRAMVTVGIPIWGDVSQTDEKKAAAMKDRNIAEDTLRVDFLGKMHELSDVYSELKIVEVERHDAYEVVVEARNVDDKAMCVIRKNGKKEKIPNCQPRYQDRVTELGTYVKALKDLLKQEKKLQRSLVSKTELYARVYGKKDWKKLKTHIRAYVKGIGG